jgi:glutamate-5-semialdehyde dehydrogenase
LQSLARITLDSIPQLIEANKKDLDRMDPTDPKYDRLMLTEERIKAITEEIHQVMNLQNPLGRILEEKTLPNGLSLKKISVPLGVLGIIYESRPNVTFDVFSLALKSGNGLVLKGSADAAESNIAIMKLIHQALKENGLPEEAFQLLPADRSATKALLEAVGYVDIIIPRGSQGLIDFVRLNAKVPVIETGAGIVHTYYDEFADLEKGKAIILNAKTRRVSVCNALDCLIIHQKRLSDLPEIVSELVQKGVTIFADEPSYAVLKDQPFSGNIHLATPEHFGTEFLSLKMSIKTVKDLEGALDHISTFSSKHSEAIISENQEHLDLFLHSVDAAAVYANASTAFTDGNQFGMGAEIGISTQKLHARGPMALNELTSYKWIIQGSGQVRE